MGHMLLLSRRLTSFLDQSLRREKMRFLVSLSLFCSLASGDTNGGVNCAVCGIVSSWVDQYASFHGKTAEQGIREICTFLPTDLSSVCDLAVTELGPYIDEIMADPDQTVDTMCHCLDLCFISEGNDQICHLLPLPAYAETDILAKCPEWVRHPKLRGGIDLLKRRMFPEFIKLLETELSIPFSIQDIIDHLLIDFGDLHQPVFDLDRDGFSDASEGLRGSWWRGTDCGPSDPDVYPGRLPLADDIYFDSNCNGIKGVDERGVPLEEKYCADYPSKGMVILGDSAGAHFAIPPNWFRPTTFNETTFKNMLMILTNELDWPMLSWATGHSENCWEEDIIGYGNVQVDSIYKRMVEWNRCGLNDYQNQANNGARS